MSAAEGSLRDAIACLPADCYAKQTWRGLLYFARDAAIYLLAVAGLASTDRAWLLVPLWALAALGISALFVVGHDAAHGALFRSPRLNALIGHLALLPSLHALSVWMLGHNRVHHLHTGCEGIDFVWHPLTPAQYRALPRHLRLLHRLQWSAAGAGLYYLHHVWWHRMGRAVPPARLRAAFRRDRLLVAAFAGAASVAALAVGSASGGVGPALWTWVKVLVVPWLLWNWCIGITVYVHHVGPDIPWHARRRWHRVEAQLHGTATYRLPSWLNFFWHNIYLHTVHHVDPRVPFYHLPRAARALAQRYPTSAPVRPFGLAHYLRTTRACKLYDFEREEWLDYRGMRRTA